MPNQVVEPLNVHAVPKPKPSVDELEIKAYLLTLEILEKSKSQKKE